MDSEKRKTAIAPNPITLEWVDEQIARGRFSSRTHALEASVYLTKMIDEWSQLDGINVFSQPILIGHTGSNNVKNIKVSVSPKISTLKWINEKVNQGIFENVSQAFDSMIAMIREWDAFQEEYCRPVVAKFYDR